VLIDPVSHNTVAVGMIVDVQMPDAGYRITDKKSEKRETRDEIEKIIKGESLINKKERTNRYKQKGCTIWITGLHGIGKNELAYTLERELFDLGAITVLLDGKSIRSGLSRELDYSPADRAENLRRVAHICKLLNDQGIITICSFISPDENIRQQVSEIIGPKRFHLVYLKATLDFAKENDKYGLYALAENGKIEHLAGIDCEYEEPSKPSIVLEAKSKRDYNEKIIHLLEKKEFLSL